eukprot:g3664.t1
MYAWHACSRGFVFSDGLLMHRLATRKISRIANQAQKRCARTLTSLTARQQEIKKLSEKTPLPFAIVDSTLREGEQFGTCGFTSHDRLYIAQTLDYLGVEYIECVNPMAGIQAIEDLEAITALGLEAKILTHIRCHMEDVKLAVETGVDGVNIYMATSAILRQHSHGKGIDEIIQIANEVIKYAQQHGLETRFSCEDSFRSQMEDLLKVYKAVDALNVDRIGIADTVGVATPEQVRHVVSTIKAALKPSTGIEFHGHNDTGCCIANAHAALLAGATHIDTTVLGIGERNGIPPLGGFLARMYTIDKEYVQAKYDLSVINYLDRYVAQRSDISIPFNNYITGSAAFTHKAGVHSKAVMANPSAYEVIDPRDWGVDRRIQVGHRLTGWNALAQKAKDLGLNLTAEQVKQATALVKELSDKRKVGPKDVERILRRMAQENDPQNADNPVFVRWADQDPEELMRQVELELDEELELRPHGCVQVIGHLTDTRILNRMLDMAVESPCEFKVVRLDVGRENNLKSVMVLQFWGQTADEVDVFRRELNDFVKAQDPAAECSIREYTMAMALRDQVRATPKMKTKRASKEEKNFQHGITLCSDFASIAAILILKFHFYCSTCHASLGALSLNANLFIQGHWKQDIMNHFSRFVPSQSFVAASILMGAASGRVI